MLIPKLKTALAGIYEVSPDSFHLYKSGRAAIRGLLESLKKRDPDRSTVFIPDYVCNVIDKACRAAGFEVLIYPTTSDCMPLWPELKNLLSSQAHPTLMLCSLFGTVPLLHPEARTLIETNPSLFILADECQNLVSKPKIHPTPNQAVILSFNDKTCPGHMGGALLLAPGSGLAISFARSSLSNRILCSLGLWKLFYSSVIDHLCMRIRSLIGKSPHFAIPTLPEYSSCTRPHYDCEAEPIYALSAAKALYSLKHLPRYETSRSKNFRFLTDNGLISGHNPAHSDDPPPPFVPSDGPRESLPFPLKAPYACEPGSSKRPQAYAIKINKSYIPHKT